MLRRGGSVTQDDILEMNGLSEKLLNDLSYKSNLGISLKKNPHYFDKEKLLEELFSMTVWLMCNEALDEIALDYRIKSMDSIIGKYERYHPDNQTRKVFNDILGFRAFCDSYDEVITLQSNVFKIVDMSNGKVKDDGYRGVHLYYQLDNHHYPIEIQFNTLYDRQLNNWLHEYVYKKSYTNDIGRKLRKKYEEGKIRTQKEFREVLEHVLSDS